MDTAINIESGNWPKASASYIKLTRGKLYRITGTAAQLKGVQPDILIPDILQSKADREANEPFALPANTIDANKYYKPYQSLDIAALKALAEKEINADNYFKTLEQYIQQYKTLQKDKDISLQWDDALLEKKKYMDVISEKPTAEVINTFSIDNNAYEKQRLQTDAELKEMNEEFKSYLLHDHYLKIAFDLLSFMANKGP
ncbi:MAG TPA: carboxy terminal-processing peptidase, partial [Chitinophagaceae bacterium]|nr:carboxy terminal-processing peptidase [Chitinophagaceae bacterium]